MKFYKITQSEEQKIKTQEETDILMQADSDEQSSDSDSDFEEAKSHQSK